MEGGPQPDGSRESCCEGDGTRRGGREEEGRAAERGAATGGAEASAARRRIDGATAMRYEPEANWPDVERD